MSRLKLHLFVIRDAVDETFGKGNDAFLAALAEYTDQEFLFVDAVPGEHLAFRNTQPRTINQFQQDAGAHLRKCRIFG